MNVEVFTPSRGTFVEVLAGGFGGGGGFIIPSDVARKSLPNVFLREQTLNGLRLVPTIVNGAITPNYTVTSTDSVLWVDASANPVTIHLQPSVGVGQLLLVKKVDSSLNSVTILPAGVDLIDSDPSVVLTNQWDWIELVDSVFGNWGNFSRLGAVNLPTNIAYTDASNIFTAANFFTGLGVVGKVIESNYTVTEQDNVLLVKADDGPIDITLPPTKPSADPDPRYSAWLYFKNIGTTSNVISIVPALGDTIDGAVSVNFDTLYADLMLFDGAPGIWTNVGATNAGATATWGNIVGTLSDQLDLQAALDLKLDIPSPLPARPTTTNEVIQVLVDVGLCAA